MYLNFCFSQKDDNTGATGQAVAETAILHKLERFQPVFGMSNFSGVFSKYQCVSIPESKIN
ncbi:hypothetical protein [Iningainema tapete]|uniref:Uncharacterized protein n=1 Tax=Iningainema tapete BLCC-T55 TaxID=2748662 RepID=A0A8J6XKZ5_9CYAN|nr:hypothetical protein [Iningainema tapete BLCC-T55]